MMMKEKRELTCIGCPMGCNLFVTIEDGKVIEVKGNTCIKGKTYAQKECTNPTRIVTSSVKVKNGELNMVSVKTQQDIPKDKIMDCIKELKDVEVEAPIQEGDIIIKNVAGTGIDIIATKNISRVV
ncbi:CxxC motif-containing protein [Garciella nitratireducens DSM 15102]|uniref:CxxC motif-containing protein n=2 Tax=Garciella TaxID=218204 RepID=A0A1T4NV59_9FIRM|nr:CxxC motif-containing protein [Garciella nitratireducens]SJZ83134.1 CxxC motif-containing protein [Garciella nitratireducens DSM 15102]